MTDGGACTFERLALVATGSGFAAKRQKPRMAPSGYGLKTSRTAMRWPTASTWHFQGTAIHQLAETLHTKHLQEVIEVAMLLVEGCGPES
jgi:hypothetical protein